MNRRSDMEIAKDLCLHKAALEKIGCHALAAVMGEAAEYLVRRAVEEVLEYRAAKSPEVMNAEIEAGVMRALGKPSATILEFPKSGGLRL